MASVPTHVIDARRGLVMPGFNDAHVHFLLGARSLRNLDLSGETTVEGILARVAAFGQAHPEREWLLGRGWFYAPFPGGMPTREQLDRVVPDRPAVFEAYDGHTTWLNSPALERAGITRKTPNPARGEICGDAGGEPSGVLKEAAMELVDRVIPQPSLDEDLAALQGAMRQAAGSGLTSVQEAGAGIDEFALYEQLRDAGHHTLRIRLAQRMAPGLSLQDWERKLAGYEAAAFPRRRDPWISAGIVKAFADGVVESGTAAMLQPYEGWPWASPAPSGHRNGSLGS